MNSLLLSALLGLVGLTAEANYPQCENAFSPRELTSDVCLQPIQPQKHWGLILNPQSILMCQTLLGIDSVESLSAHRIWFNISQLQNRFSLTRLQALEMQAQYQELLVKHPSPTDSQFENLLQKVKGGESLSGANEKVIEKTKGLIGLELTSFILQLKEIKSEGDFILGLHQQVIEFRRKAFAVGFNPGFVYLLKQLLPLGYGFTVYSDLSSQELKELLRKVKLGENNLEQVFLAQFSKGFQVGHRDNSLNTHLYLESQIFENRDTFIIQGLKPNALYHPDEGVSLRPFAFEDSTPKVGVVSQLRRLNPFSKNTLAKYLESQKVQGQTLALNLSHGLVVMKQLGIPLTDALRPYSYAGSEVLKMLGEQKNGNNQAQLNIILSMMPYSEFLKLAQKTKGLASSTDWPSP